MATILQLGEHSPRVAPSAWIAANATLVGDVTVADETGIYYGAVLRADLESITFGAGSNLQDNAAIHADPGFPAAIGKLVSIGHGAVLHGCTVEDGALIGMNATILNGAIIGAGSLVAANALVLEGTVIPPRSLVAGVPAKVRRELTDEEVENCRMNAVNYRRLSREHTHTIEAETLSITR